MQLFAGLQLECDAVIVNINFSSVTMYIGEVQSLPLNQEACIQQAASIYVFSAHVGNKQTKKSEPIHTTIIGHVFYLNYGSPSIAVLNLTGVEEEAVVVGL